MKSAGLTHGGFYANFNSKEDLMAESCEHSLTKLNEGWDKAASGKNGDLLRAVVAVYLSTSHRDDPGNGCPIAALGSVWHVRVPRSATPSPKVFDPLSSY
jgi:TetR/AcrR family transcriptional repressor of nem operon